MVAVLNPVTIDAVCSRTLRAEPKVSFGRLVGLLDYANPRSDVSPQNAERVNYVPADAGEGLSRKVMGVTREGHAVPLSKEMVQLALRTARVGYTAFLVGGTREEMVVSGGSCLGVYHSELAVSAVQSESPAHGFDPLSEPTVNPFGVEGRKFVRGVRPDSVEVYLNVPTNLEVMDGGQRFTPWRVALEHALGEVVR
ncbi:MAG: hypothetical protein AABW86_01615 [Candidatus Micrarchaeota archaeon]